MTPPEPQEAQPPTTRPRAGPRSSDLRLVYRCHKRAHPRARGALPARRGRGRPWVVPLTPRPMAHRAWATVWDLVSGLAYAAFLTFTCT